MCRTYVLILDKATANQTLSMNKNVENTNCVNDDLNLEVKNDTDSKSLAFILMPKYLEILIQGQPSIYFPVGDHDVSWCRSHTNSSGVILQHHTLLQVASQNYC